VHAGAVALALESVALGGSVHDGDAALALTQTFAHGGGEALAAASYCFPLTKGVAVFSVSAEIRAPGAPTRRVAAAVQERAAARRVFSDAVAQGRSAVLLEQSAESMDVFKLQLGTIPARGRVTVRVGFLQELHASADEARPAARAQRLLLSMALLHRWCPAAGGDAFREDAGAPGAWDVAGATAEGGGAAAAAAAHPLQIELVIASSAALAAVGCPSHGGGAAGGAEVEGEVAPGGRGGRFTLRVAAAAWASRAADVHILLTQAEEEGGGEVPPAALLVEEAVAASAAGAEATPPALATAGAGVAAFAKLDGAECVALGLRLSLEGALALMAPPSGAVGPILPTEYFFLMDSSGSMSGTRFEKAQAALALAVGALPEGAQFQVFFFDTTVCAAFPGPEGAATAHTVEVNAANLAAARAFIEGATAAGGTALFPALERALLPSAVGPTQRDVFIFTDGDIGNATMVEKQVRDAVAAAGARGGSLRVHALGIGNDVGTAAILGVAAAGGGLHDMLADGEPFEAKMGRVVEAAMGAQGGVAASVTWALAAGCEPLSAPLPRSGAWLQPGHAQRLLTWLRKPRGMPLAEALRGATVELRGCGAAAGAAVRRPLLDLVGDCVSVVGGGAGPLALRVAQAAIEVAEQSNNAAAAVAVSTTWQVLCPHTAFVGVEEAVGEPAAGAAGGPQPPRVVSAAGVPAASSRAERALAPMANAAHAFVGLVVADVGHAWGADIGMSGHLFRSCRGRAGSSGFGSFHGDIKPQNLLADRKGALEFTDFGLARAFMGSGDSRYSSSGSSALVLTERVHNGQLRVARPLPLAPVDEARWLAAPWLEDLASLPLIDAEAKAALESKGVARTSMLLQLLELFCRRPPSREAGAHLLALAGFLEQVGIATAVARQLALLLAQKLHLNPPAWPQSAAMVEAAKKRTFLIPTWQAR
jgi:hypothetical protein